MIIIRPIDQKDTEAFIQMAYNAGIGMTSMPKNREILEKRIKESIEAFSKKPNGHSFLGTYLFVLEDTDSGEIGGTSGIASQTGRQFPIPFFKLKKLEHHEGIGPLQKIVPTLHVIYHENYWSEVCSLYLKPEFRHSGFGRLLSLSRFLFIAAFPDRFESMIFAEMRGYVDENQTSPFWEGIGKHFVDATFETLTHLRDEGILNLSRALPWYPIYTELLPKIVQESIGKIHEETKSAFQMLIQEGFKVSDEYDVCDGGPKIEMETKSVRSLKESVVDNVAEILDEIPCSPHFILSNNQLNFRACLSPIKKLQNGGIAIPPDVAKALELSVGSTVRYTTPYKDTRK